MWFLTLLGIVACLAVLYALVRLAAKHGYQDALRAAESDPAARAPRSGSDLIGAPREKAPRPAAGPGNQTASPRDI